MAARRSATDQKKFLAHLDKLFQNPDKERLEGSTNVAPPIEHPYATPSNIAVVNFLNFAPHAFLPKLQ
jgi:hypothetical protein